MSLVRESVPLAPPWLPLWGSCHEVTERVKNALSAPLGHLSHRERQVALIRLALAGDARATFTLWSNCHRQLIDLNSLRGAPPLVSKGSLGRPMAAPTCAESVLGTTGGCDRRESPEGATPVFATLRYDCHWQSLLFSIRCAEHRWFAMTYGFRFYSVKIERYRACTQWRDDY